MFFYEVFLKHVRKSADIILMRASGKQVIIVKFILKEKCDKTVVPLHTDKS